MKYKIGDRVKMTARKNGDRGRIGLFGTIIGSYMNRGTNHFCVEFDEHIEGHDGNGSNSVRGKFGYCWWYCEGCGSEFDIIRNTQKIVITSDGKETLARLYDGNKVIKTATAKCSPDDTFDFETGARIAFERLVETPFTKAIKDLAEAAKKCGEHIRKSLCEKPLKFEVGKQYADGELVIEITEANREIRSYNYKVIKGEDSGPLKSFQENSTFGTRLTPYDPPKYFTGKAVCIKSDKDFTVGKVYEFVDGQTIDNAGSKRPRGYRIEKSFDVWKEKSYDMYDFLPLVE